MKKVEAQCVVNRIGTRKIIIIKSIIVIMIIIRHISCFVSATDLITCACQHMTIKESSYYYYYYYHYHHHHHHHHLYLSSPYARYLQLYTRNNVSIVYSVAAVLYSQSVLHIILFLVLNMLCTSTLALSAVCAQWPIWLFSVLL